jgi:hypothetical protein
MQLALWFPMLLSLASVAESDVAVQGPLAVDTARYVVFRMDAAPKDLFEEEVVPEQVGAADLHLAEQVLARYKEQCLRKAISRGTALGDLSGVDLDEDLRQYLGARDAKGHRLLYVNGFCQAYDIDWKHNWVSVEDGGPCFWQAIIDLTTGTVIRALVNGKG